MNLRSVLCLSSAFWLLFQAACASTPDAEMLKSEARWALERGRPHRALEALRRATEIAPRDVEAFSLLGQLAMREQHLVEAEVALARAIELDPSDPGLRVARGLALKRLGRLSEAESSLLHALILRPAHPVTLVSLAEVYRLLGEPDKCMARYGQFLWQLSRSEDAGSLDGAHEVALRRARDREEYCQLALP